MKYTALKLNSEVIKLGSASILLFLANIFITKYVGLNFGEDGLLNYSTYLNISALILVISCLGSESGLVRESFDKDLDIKSRNLLYVQIISLGLALGLGVIVIAKLFSYELFNGLYPFLLIYILFAFLSHSTRVTLLHNQKGYIAMFLNACVVIALLLIFVISSKEASLSNFIMIGSISYLVIYCVSYLVIRYGTDLKNTYFISLDNLNLKALISIHPKLTYILSFCIVTSASLLLFNFSELFMRSIAINFGLNNLYANIEAYVRVSSWWYGFGISILGYLYFPRFSKDNAEKNIKSNREIFMQFILPLLALLVLGTFFGGIIFLFVYNNVFKLDIIVLIVFSLSTFIKLFGITFSMLALVEKRFKANIFAELIVYMIPPIFITYILFLGYELSIKGFSFAILFANLSFFLFLLISRMKFIKI